MTSRFISFEGIDGAGKSTHIDALAARFRAQGQEVVLTREPGGTPLAERLRAELLQSPMDPLTESLLAFAARRDHLNTVIRPALAAGKTVLCDRFTDATFAYQGAGRGLSTDTLERLEGWVQEGLQPSLTVWFDLSPQIAAERRAAVRAADRFEAEDLVFFQRVRAGYQARMDSDPSRFVRLDAGQPREAVWSELLGVLELRGW